MGTSHYGRAYEIKLKTFHVGDIVLFTKKTFEVDFIFEVADIENEDTLIPMAGSVVAVNRVSAGPASYFCFDSKKRHPEKFLAENCRRLLNLEAGKFRSWVHMKYKTAGYDERLLAHYQREGDGV